MKMLSAAIIVFSGALCVSAAAFNGSPNATSATAAWATFVGIVVVAVGLFGWITKLWEPDNIP
jgi:hypothetical protein